MKKNRLFSKYELISLLSLGFYFIFYLFFAFYDGVFMSADSETYISMSFTREPFYSLILAFFRHLSSENYLMLTVIFQSILTAFCSWKLADYLRKNFQLPTLFGLLIYTIPLGTSLLCRFAAKRASMYSNTILTEGIVIPLYLLFMFYIISFSLDSNKKHLIRAIILSFLMISTRKQMFITIPLLICALGINAYKAKTIKKHIIATFFIVVTILAGNTLFESSYNYVLHGKFQKHSSGNRFFTTMVFYNANIEDANYIEDPSIQDLFVEIYNVCDEKEYLGSHAPKGWLTEVNHFGDHYDHIQINTMWPMILEHAKDNLDTNDVASIDMEADRINNVIITSVLPHQLPKLLHSLYNNLLSGLMTTIAQRRAILIPFCILLYLGYFILTLGLLRNRTSSIKHQDTIILSILTMSGILLNVALVSLVIFCQTRYTIYNMPLFYSTGVILLYKNLEIYLHNRKRGS